MDLTKLQNVGMKEKESKIYITLLELKESTVTKLSKKVNINRSLLYFILSDLEKRGFVSYIIKNNVRYYRPIEPERILDKLEENKKSFEAVLPELWAIRTTQKQERPQIEILEGREGIKTILNEILRLKKEWFAFNTPGEGPKVLGPIVHSFQIQRQKKKIPLYVLSTNTEKARKRGREFARMKHTKVRYLKESYDSPASNYIYSDRLVIIFWYKQFPFAIRIIDKNLADSYKNYFKALWKVSSKY